MRRVVLLLLWVVVLLVPLENLFVIPQFGTITRLVGYGTMAVAVVVVGLRMKLRRPPAVWLVAASFVAWVWLSLLWSDFPEDTLTRARTFLSQLLFFWLIWEFAPTLKEQNRLLHAFIFGLTATLVMLYYGFAFDPGGVGQALVRYGGGGLNLNRQAVMLVMSILLALNFGAALAFEQSRWRTFYWLYVPAAVVAVPLTGSRQGFVCLLVAGAASLPLLRRAPWWSKLLLAIIAIGAVLAIVRTTPQILMERIASPEEYDPETGALGGRRVLWERGLEVLAEKNLLTGIGAGTYSSATATGTRIIAVAHNVFVGVLVETGIIGLILYTTMLAMLARQVWKIANEERLLWITMLSIWGLAALVGSSEYEKFTWFLFGIVTARCAALPQRAMGAKNATIPATNVIPTANLRPAGFPRKR